MSLGLALVLLTVRRAGGEVWSNIFNVLHVLLSASIALVSLRLSRKLLDGWFPQPWHHYAWAAAVVFVLGAGLEIAQFYVPGLPSLQDFVIDMVGGLAALGLVFGLSQRRRHLRWAMGVASLGVLACALASPGMTLWRAARRAQRFPVLSAFTRVEFPYVLLNDGARLAMREETSEADAEWRAGLTIPAGRDYPGLQLTPPAGDWSGSTDLVVPIYSNEGGAFPLQLRVHDDLHTGEFEDRFNTELTVHEGRNEFRIPISHIAHGPHHRVLDLARVDAIVLFASKPARAHEVLLGTWRLEGARGH